MPTTFDFKVAKQLSSKIYDFSLLLHLLTPNTEPFIFPSLFKFPEAPLYFPFMCLLTNNNLVIAAGFRLWKEKHLKKCRWGVLRFSLSARAHDFEQNIRITSYYL